MLSNMLHIQLRSKMLFFSFIWSRVIKVMTEFSPHECSIDSLLRNIFEILSISQCVVYKAGNIYLTSPLTFIFLLWTINGKKKKKKNYIIQDLPKLIIISDQRLQSTQP